MCPGTASCGFRTRTAPCSCCAAGPLSCHPLSTPARPRLQSPHRLWNQPWMPLGPIPLSSDPTPPRSTACSLTDDQLQAKAPWVTSHVTNTSEDVFIWNIWMSGLIETDHKELAPSPSLDPTIPCSNRRQTVLTSSIWRRVSMSMMNMLQLRLRNPLADTGHTGSCIVFCRTSRWSESCHCQQLLPKMDPSGPCPHSAYPGATQANCEGPPNLLTTSEIQSTLNMVR